MKKLILPTFLIFLFLLISSTVLAQEPRHIKAECAEISSTLHFRNKKDDAGFYGCESQENDIPVGNMIVRLSGEVWNSRLPEDISGPDEPYTSNVTPDKIENLQIGDQGKIFYWGPPWGEVRPDPYIEYRAVIGQCEMVLTGGSLVDIKFIFDESRTGPFKADFDKASEFMIQKLSAAAKEVEAAVSEGCAGQKM